ncbi:MAG: Uma2 family endonuclease [Rhodobacteraceae bacterium]|nr:Uma2 family endonuclease [Paracoccaceae bacterium]
MKRARRIAGMSRNATYQDVLDAPPHMVAEVVAGTLHTHPRPAKPHAWASSVMGIEIGAPFGRGRGGPGGWLIFDEPELHVGEDIVVPELAGWRRETMSEDMEGAYFTQAPDWVCEVLSPSTRRLDQGEKRSIYAREKVPHLWFVDPDARTLEAFELRGKLWVLLATLVDDALVSLPPFEAISFPLDALWPEMKATVVEDRGDR